MKEVPRNSEISNLANESSKEDPLTRIWQKKKENYMKLFSNPGKMGFPKSEVEASSNCKRLTEKTSNEKGKVRKQANALEDPDESQSSVTVSQASEVSYPNYKNILMVIEQLSMSYEDSHSLTKIQKAVHSYQKIIEFKKSHCSQCLLHKKEVAKLENKFDVIKEELSEMKKVKTKLEQKEIKYKQELCNLRYDVKEKEKKRRNVDQLFEKMSSQLREKSEEYNKEIELNKELQVSFRTLKTELKTARNNLNQVSTRNEREKELLPKYHILQDEFAMMSLELDKIKCQKQENEKKYIEVIEILREKNDDLQRTIKRNEETLTKTTFQYNAKISILQTEITKQKLKLENNKRSTERKEMEVKSSPARWAVSLHPSDESQTSKRGLECPSQRARDGCLGLKHKKNFNVSKLNVSSDILSQKFSKPGIKMSRGEIKFYSHIMHDIRKTSKVLKQVKRDVKQTQCQLNEMKHMYQNDQHKKYKYIEKKECIDEQLSQMENEVTLLQRLLHDLNNKLDNNGLIVYLQEQCNIVKISQDEAEKSTLELKKLMELMKENHCLKEKLYQNKMEKSKRETDNLIATLEDISSKILQLDAKYALSLKSLQNRCDKAESNQKKLEEDLANLKRLTQNNLVERGQGEQHKWKAEQRTRQHLQQNPKQTHAAASEILKRLRENNTSISCMQLILDKLESEVSKMKTENSNEIHIKEYNQLHRQECQNDIQKFNKSLLEVNSRFPVEKRSKSLPCPHCRRPVPGCPCVKLENDNWVHNGNCIQGENIAGSTSNPQPSCQSIEDYLAENLDLDLLELLP